MKGILSTLVVAGTLLVGSAAMAQVTRSLPEADSPLTAIFYDGNPFDGGAVLEGNTAGSTVKANLTSSSLGIKVDNSEDADFVLIQVGPRAGLAFDIQGGGSPNSISLTGVNGSDDLKLADVAEDLHAAFENEANLAIFINEDGVVTGFYAFEEGNAPNINVDDAAYIVLTFNGQVNVFQSPGNPGARPLEDVRVEIGDGESIFTL